MRVACLIWLDSIVIGGPMSSAACRDLIFKKSSLARQAEPPHGNIVGAGGDVDRREGVEPVPLAAVLELDAEQSGRPRPQPHPLKPALPLPFNGMSTGEGGGNDEAAPVKEWAMTRRLWRRSGR